MKRLFAVLLLAGILVGAWYAGRLFLSRTSARVTVIFDEPTGLVAGNHIVDGSLVIGEVSKVVQLDGNQEAVSIVLAGAHRENLRSDSLLRTEGEPPAVRVVVSNTIAVGPVVQDGAVLHARQDRVTRWIEKASELVTPYLRELADKSESWARQYDSKEFEAQLERWGRQIPEWKKQGNEVFERNMKALEDGVAVAEKLLRNAKRDADASDLRRRFDAWLARWKDLPEDSKPKAPAGAANPKEPAGAAKPAGASR